LVLLVGVLSVWHCPSVHSASISLVLALTLKASDGVTRVIPHQPVACLVTPPYFPLVASVSRGILASEESALEVQEAPGADGTSLGIVSVEVDGASPHPGDDTRGLLQD
jgi:hypothetical protein